MEKPKTGKIPPARCDDGSSKIPPTRRYDTFSDESFSDTVVRYARKLPAVTVGLAVLSVPIIGVMAGLNLVYSVTGRSIPSDKKVQSGYVPPGKLEVVLRDADRNGEKETVLKIDGREYQLKYDDAGQPALYSGHQ